MPSINNYFGTKKTEGEIFYRESLRHGLTLVITQQYIHKGNDCLVFEAGICNQIHESGSIRYYHNAYEWCTDSKKHLSDLKTITTDQLMPVIPSYKPKMDKEEYITDSGITIKKHTENVRDVTGGKSWKYVWRAHIGKDKLLSVIIRKKEKNKLKEK